SFRDGVAGNAMPSLDATQNFNVVVNAPAAPTMTSVVMSNGQFRASVPGVVGPDYIIQTSTNLTIWTNYFATNPVAMPFVWMAAITTNSDRQFYRILLGP
ncbi:MAG: hypothetical protein WCS42_22585, partial [Verrucomicrobiota bacterium]